MTLREQKRRKGKDLPVASPQQPNEGSIPWRWSEGSVDPADEHSELRHGDATAASYEQWALIAIVGGPVRRTFPVPVAE